MAFSSTPMQRTPGWVRLAVVAMLSVSVMVFGILVGYASLTIAAGVMFALESAYAAWRLAATPVPAAATDRGNRVAARFADLLALNWAWAGAAMLACYYLTGLFWQHAWQYGLAMVLIAAAIYAYGRQREGGSPTWSAPAYVTAARYITALQALAALVGVVILMFSGKLEIAGRDWAANVVFVSGGLAIIATSIAALRAERKS